jgi:hypothetical protein
VQYTVRAYIEGEDSRLDEVCRVFCSMERSSYNLLREGASFSDVRTTLRERYSVKNTRWIQSAVNQARAVMSAQEKQIGYRLEMYNEKMKNTRKKMKNLNDLLRLRKCQRKIHRLQSMVNDLREELRNGSYPMAIFGSKKLMRRLLKAHERRRKVELSKAWREGRSNHFFSVGQANQRGNGNTRLHFEPLNCAFHLELRNWTMRDLVFPLGVPSHWRNLLKDLIRKAESVKLGPHGELLSGSKGVPYSIRVIRSTGGYQVLISFELEEPIVDTRGRIMGVDVNPEGVGCAIVSFDGNLVAARFFSERRLITASKNKRKWILENMVNKMLRWCHGTHGCHAIAIERLRFSGAYDYNSGVNFKLSNFMKRKMAERIRLSALKMGMLTFEVDPAYSSRVAATKYSVQFGGLDSHELAALVIARRAQGYGEAPVPSCLPKNRRQRAMWNRCIAYYGCPPRIQTLPHHEPMERNNGGDVNGGGRTTKLLTAPPAVTFARGLSHAPAGELETQPIETTKWRAGRVCPNPHTREGDRARGHRVSPPHSMANAFPPTVENKNIAG